MSGLILHPGHEPLHGVTVVVSGASGQTYVGRYHERRADGVLMKDTAVHDPATSEHDLPTFLARTLKFGVKVAHKQLLIPTAEVGEIRRLLE